MAVKVFVALCASVLLVKTISAQYINAAPINYAPACGNSLPGANYQNSGNNGYNYNNGANSNGGSFPISTSSLVAPGGISIVSENNIEGTLLVTGNLPVLAAVAVDGQLPTSGSASTTYSCGNGNVGIENIGGAPNAGGLAGPAAPGCGYNIY